MMKNKRLHFSILILVVVIACSLVYKSASSPIIVEGTVDHKVITGLKGDTSYTILVNRMIDNRSWILLKDKSYGEFFPKKDNNTFISKSLEDKMKSEYSDIKYLVSIRLDSRDPINGIDKGEALAYFVSKEDFNKKKIGDKVKYIMINPLHQPFTNDHYISLQSIKNEAIMMLKVVILAMCFERDITFVISELKAKASLKEFTGF